MDASKLQKGQKVRITFEGVIALHDFKSVSFKHPDSYAMPLNWSDRLNPTIEIGGETITRVPPGYAKDHPRGELLRHKTLTARKELGCPDWVATKRAKTEIVKAWRKLAPLTSWLDTHVGRD